LEKVRFGLAHCEMGAKTELETWYGLVEGKRLVREFEQKLRIVLRRVDEAFKESNRNRNGN
jgi:hypothetical protein